MAQSIACPPAAIKRRFCHLLPCDVIIKACCESGHRWRARKFDPVVTLHLFILQVLNSNTAIVHLRHLAGSAVNAAAYCQARMRLPLAVYEKLLEYTAQAATQGCQPVFAALRVFLVDGTSSLTPDTPSIRKLFRQPANIRPGCGYPMAKVLALFDAASGAILQPLICALYVHEASCVWRLHPPARSASLSRREDRRVVRLALADRDALCAVENQHEDEPAQV